MAQERPFDAIVIGSGLGGLTCAAYLAAAGRRTLVLESHYVAGGNSQVFRRTVHGRDYEFDVGLHYIGECGPRRARSRASCAALGLAERVVFRPLDPDGYSTLVFPDLTFRVPAGWDRYRARLLETFPEEADALGRGGRRAARGGRRRGAASRTASSLADASPRTRPRCCAWGLRPVTELFDAHGLSERAAAVLLGEQGDYAVRPSRTPVALAAGLTDHYMRGAFYPEGGGQVIAARLVEAIRAYGGEVRTRAPVARVRVEGGPRARASCSRGGERDRRAGRRLERGSEAHRARARRRRALHARDGRARARLPDVAPALRVYLGARRRPRRSRRPEHQLLALGHLRHRRPLRARSSAAACPTTPLAYLTVASLKDPTNPAPRAARARRTSRS